VLRAAADVILALIGDTWTLEECGDPHPSGAAVGAHLQASIAREPSERRPTIRGWLPGDSCRLKCRRSRPTTFCI